jgi:4-hydroxyphenylpyruvate dioxygenase-like putative hemolysin
MSLNGLEATIQVEQEVQAHIAAEQKKADLWMQEQKTVLAQQNAAEQSNLSAIENQERDRLRKEYEDKAAAYLCQAEEQSLFIEKIDHSTLNILVRQALLSTLPGFDP